MSSEQYLLSLLNKKPAENYSNSTFINQKQSPFIKYYKDKLTARYVGKGLLYTDIVSIQSNKPVNKETLIYYYEVKINDFGQRGDLCIGFAESSFPLNKHPGWTRNSYGYKADGKLYTAKHSIEFTMPKFKKNDIIGCGINFFKKEIFFTHNGELKGPAFKDIELCDFHATIGLHSLNECVTMNFGRSNFQLSLDKLILDEKRATIKQILEQQIHHFDVHKIVHNYLYFHGYYETLQAFEKSSNFQREDTVLLKEFSKKIDHPQNLQNQTIEVEETNEQDLQEQQQQQQQQQQKEFKIELEAQPTVEAQLTETAPILQECKEAKLEEHKQQETQEEEEKKEEDNKKSEEQKIKAVEEKKEQQQLEEQVVDNKKLQRGMRAVSCHIDMETPELMPRKVSNISDLFELSLVAKEQSLELQKQNSLNFFQQQMNVLTAYDLERQNIRNYLMEGKIFEVIRSLENNFPHLLEENPQLLLQLKSQIFIEIIKSGDTVEAVKYATDNFSSSQSEKIKAYNNEGKLEDKTVEDLIGLICYIKPEESILSSLVSNQQRDLVADLVHKQILKSLNFSNKSILELMISQLMQIEEQFKQTNQFYGSIFEFKVQ